MRPLAFSSDPTQFDFVLLIQKLAHAEQHVKRSKFAAVQFGHLRQHFLDMALDITAEESLRGYGATLTETFTIGFFWGCRKQEKDKMENNYSNLEGWLALLAMLLLHALHCDVPHPPHKMISLFN